MLFALGSCVARRRGTGLGTSLAVGESWTFRGVSSRSMLRPTGWQWMSSNETRHGSRGLTSTLGRRGRWNDRVDHESRCESNPKRR